MTDHTSALDAAREAVERCENNLSRAKRTSWDIDPYASQDETDRCAYELVKAQQNYIRELEAANAATELEAVLRWLQKKRTFIHEQADTFKGDMENLWNSGLLSELATCDEWYAEVADALEKLRT